MQTEPRPRPAATAVLVFVSGLLAAPAVVSPAAALAGLIAISASACTLRARRGVRAGVLCLVAVLGLLVGLRVDDCRRVENARLTTLSPDAFTTVRVVLEDDWVRRPDGAWRLRARSFEVVEDGGSGFEVDRRIHVLLYDARPPETAGARLLTGRGFLRELDRGAFVLSVKSSALLKAEGRASHLDPRTWNRRLSRRLDEASVRSERARLGNALVQALVLGRGGLIPWEVIDLYQRGGTYHLLVFSGVQIAMMAALVRWLLLRLGWRRAADAALLLVCVLMPRFVGVDPSVSRSALMIGLLLFSWLWERPTDASNLLFVSALIRLVLVPQDLTDPGFALTYSATAGILVIGRALAHGRGRVGRLLGYGLGAELGTTPFTLFFFNRATLGGSIVTLLVSPVVSAMLGLGFVATALAPLSPGACGMLLEVVASMNGVVMWMNRLVAEEWRLSLVGAAPSASVLVACLAAATVASAAGSRRAGFVAAICLVLPLASAVLNSMPDKSVEAAAHFLDVGQGDATLVVSRSRAILVDGGGSGSDPAFGTRTLLPLLAERRARRIDAVLLSHPHPDHCGGLVTVLRDLEVGRLILSRRHVASECGRALIDIALRRGVPVDDAEASRFLQVGDVSVEVLTVRHLYRRSRENNSSVVARLAAGGRRVLLTGDIEREAEMILVEREAERLSADILKVPHHGSRSSTSGAFLAAVRPRIAIVSSGRMNRFGHPHAEPLAALERAGVRVEETATSGNLEVLFAQGHLFIRREFDSARAYP